MRPWRLPVWHQSAARLPNNPYHWKALPRIYTQEFDSHGRNTYTFGYTCWQQLQRPKSARSVPQVCPHFARTLMSAHSHRNEGFHIPKDYTVTPLRIYMRMPCDALTTISCIAAEMLTLASWEILVVVFPKVDVLPGTRGFCSDASANNSHVAAESDVS